MTAAVADPFVAAQFASGNSLRESRLNLAQDFRPEWDVPTLNQHASDALLSEITRLQKRQQPTPDPAQMIHVLLAQPGFGKTHLFARVGQRLGDHQAFFVYVPPFADAARPMEHIRWHVVESLFRPRPGRLPVLASILVRLCQPSFCTYFSQFPKSLADRNRKLIEGVQARETAIARVAEIAKGVKELPPFLRLAESMVEAFPSLPAAVVRALALGWSPAADDARRWLRGDVVPEEVMTRLGLPERSPQTTEILSSVATLSRFKIPTVICFDQVESLLKATEGPLQFSSSVMEILQTVPNQLLVLGCLESEWEAFRKRGFESAWQRCQNPSLHLKNLDPVEAIDLLARRLSGWTGPRNESNRVWPFDQNLVVQYVNEKKPHPRQLVQRCAAALDQWIQEGQHGLIDIVNAGQIMPPEILFRKEWDQELEKIAHENQRQAKNQEEARLRIAVFEVLSAAKDAVFDCGGATIKALSLDPVQMKSGKPAYGVKAEMSQWGQTYQVVVPVTRLDQGPTFLRYFHAVEEASKGSSTFCLLIHEKEKFAMGKVTAAAFEKAQQKGKLRLFALDVHGSTYERMECYLTLLNKAANGELILGRDVIGADKFKSLVIETKVLEGLDLFQNLGGFLKLPAEKPVAPKPPPAPAAAEIAAAPRTPPVSTPESATTAAVPPPVQTPPPPAAPVVTPPDETVLAWANEKLEALVEKLTEWGQPVDGDGVEIGPSFARLRVKPAGSKTSIKRVTDKAGDLRVSLGVEVEPIIAPQAGYYSVDIERPKRSSVTLPEALGQMPPVNGKPVFPVGLDVAGKVYAMNLADPSDCHLLVAGTTGSGKSEFLKAMMAGLAARLSPDQIRFILIDPKRVTFNFGGKQGPYLLHPIAYEAKAARPLVKWCVDETKRRYNLLQQQRLSDFSQLKVASPLPRIVLMIDEFANLMVDKEATKTLTEQFCQISSMSRAAGIHMVLATQRPDKDVVTPLLRDNLPGRVALKVASKGNSEIIISSPNAQFLLGKGDLLCQRGGSLLRLQSPFVPQDELERIMRVT